MEQFPQTSDFMDYKKIYNQLMSRARLQHIDGYCEVHHIVPRAEGGSDDKSNLVKLTARQHYIAHLLLAKIYDDYVMLCAVIMMRHMKNKYTKREFRFNSRLYEKLKVERSRRMSTIMKGHPVNERTRRAVSETMKRVNKGRKPWNYRKHISEEVKWKLKQANLGKKQSEETIEKRRLKLLGHSCSEQTKLKLSKRLAGRKMSDESKQKMSKSHIGKPPANKGKKASLELRQKLSEAHKGHQASESTRQKVSESMSKLRWWNNEVESRRCVDSPGPEWSRGRLKEKN